MPTGTFSFLSFTCSFMEDGFHADTACQGLYYPDLPKNQTNSILVP
jgi:hypothetical protein